MRFLSFIIFSFCFCLTYGQAPNDLFSQANQNYDSEQYNDALEGYKKLLDAGHESKELYYNYANAAFKLNKKASAILYLEKAILISPGDKNVKKNLSIARESIDTEIIEIPDFLPVRFWKGFSSVLSPLVWFILQMLFGLLVLYSVYKWRISIKRKDKLNGFYAMLIFSFFLLISFLAYQASDHLLYHRNEGIVMRQTTLKSAPDLRSDDIKNLSEGVKIIVRDQIDGWVKVVLTNKEEGWIEVITLEMI